MLNTLVLIPPFSGGIRTNVFKMIIWEHHVTNIGLITNTKNPTFGMVVYTSSTQPFFAMGQCYARQFFQTGVYYAFNKTQQKKDCNSQGNEKTPQKFLFFLCSLAPNGLWPGTKWSMAQYWSMSSGWGLLMYKI